MAKSRSKAKMTVSECLERGHFASKEIQAMTGTSQPWVSTQLRSLGEKIVKLSTGRNSKYALARNAFNAGDRIPLYMVDPYGNNSRVAEMRPLYPRGFFIEPLPGAPQMLLGVNGDGVFDDLPYFLQDLRPQGFIGRTIASQLAARSEDFPANPRNWNVSHVGRYLVSAGDDLPGNFQLGEVGLLRARRKPTAYSSDEYPMLADQALAGELPGSSAGGEQPKFTVYSAERQRPVIVKFSPLGDDPVSARWRDVLISEHLAAVSLHSENHPAAETRIIDTGGRIFLEADRFDRAGEYGRHSMISVQSVDAEYLGDGSDWPTVLAHLRSIGLLSEENYYDACVQWEFGYLIYNTDMHLGNLSLGMDGNVFRLLPAYDMCSMGFAPTRGQVKPITFQPNSRCSRLDTLNGGHNSQVMVLNMAYNFWEALANADGISEDLTKYLSSGNPLRDHVSQLGLDL